MMDIYSVIGANGYIRHAEVSVFLGILSVSLVTVWILQKHCQQKNLPPGPRGVPILGILPFLGDAAYLTFTKMAETYGNVFQVYMGSRRTVVVNGMEAAKQVLVNQTDDFAGRPDFESFQYLGEGNSMSFGTCSPKFKVHKKIARSALRQFILNPATPIEHAMWHEGNLLIKDLLASEGKPAGVNYNIRMAVGSVIYGLCFGAKKQLRQDKDFEEFVRSQDSFQESQKASGNPADLMPWLSIFFQRRLKKFIAVTGNFGKFLREKTDAHKVDYNPNKLRDITDALIKAGEEYPEEELEAIGLKKEHILATVNDLIGAGFNTVTTLLHWGILYLVNFPEVQDKVQAEIDEVLGKQLPHQDDRKRLPYTEACILESMRYSSNVPFLLPHSSTRDTTLYDYFIPKDTLIFVNMWSVGRDPTVWDEPEKYDPSRFLEENGMVDKMKAENLLAFGGGKRRCLGELLARYENFVFFAMVFQKCRFEKAPGVDYDLKGKFGCSIEPQEYKYIVKERHV